MNKRKEVVYISIHSNAGGGTGYEVYTSIGETKSDFLAKLYIEQMGELFPEERFRAGASGEDKESNFYVLRHTKCPAILTENFFMDHEHDYQLLMQETNLKKIALAHVTAIKKFITKK